MYAITATIETKTRFGSTSRQVPTFYLDETVQGIANEHHAKRIALDILGQCDDLDGIRTYHVCAVKL